MNETPQYIFPTSIGNCTLSWSVKNGDILSFCLPHPELLQARPSDFSPPPHIAELVEKVREHLSGSIHDFANLPFAWSQLSPYRTKVLQSALACKAGNIWTYGQLAIACGFSQNHSRAIGGALGHNPWQLLVPCHRFVGGNGKLVGFTSYGGTAVKQRLLEIEKALPPSLLQDELF